MADENFLMGATRKIRQNQRDFYVADGRKSICAATHLSDLRKLCKSVGYNDPVSSKSVKVSGTSASFKAGLSDGQVRDKGRWRSIETSLHYRNIAPSHRRLIGQSNSMFGAQNIPNPPRNHQVDWHQYEPEVEQIEVDERHSPPPYPHFSHNDRDWSARRQREEVNVTPGTSYFGAHLGQAQTQNNMGYDPRPVPGTYCNGSTELDPSRPWSIEQLAWGVPSWRDEEDRFHTLVDPRDMEDF